MTFIMICMLLIVIGKRVNDDNATYDLENLFGTNSENDDIESLKLGDDGIENPLPLVI